MSKWLWSAFSFIVALSVMYMFGRTDGRAIERSERLAERESVVIEQNRVLQSTIDSMQGRYDAVIGEMARAAARSEERERRSEVALSDLSTAIKSSPAWAGGAVPAAVSDKLRGIADQADSSGLNDDTGASAGAAVSVPTDARPKVPAIPTRRASN